jgi:hypothetical protein
VLDTKLMVKKALGVMLQNGQSTPLPMASWMDGYKAGREELYRLKDS